MIPTLISAFGSNEVRKCSLGYHRRSLVLHFFESSRECDLGTRNNEEMPEMSCERYLEAQRKCFVVFRMFISKRYAVMND